MKKNTSPKKATAKKPATRITRTATSVRNTTQSRQCFNPWSLSIYVYWFIILFFIAATFYILGRSHNVGTTPNTNVEISEEVLLQSSDYYNSGKTKLMTGNVDDAIADLDAAIAANTNDIDAYILRGEAYMQSGNYRDALADFDMALSIDATNAVAYYDRALLNMRLEDYAAALNDINNALASQASNPSNILQMRDLYAKRGQLNLWLKNWNGAIADYTNSLARPDGTVTPNVYAERAEAYTANGQFSDAINDYTSAVRIISEQIQGAMTVEERENLSSRAMSYFEKSAALNLQLNNKIAAYSDLESAHTIAVALNDTVSIERIQSLMAELAATMN